MTNYCEEAATVVSGGVCVATGLTSGISTSRGPVLVGKVGLGGFFLVLLEMVGVGFRTLVVVP